VKQRSAIAEPLSTCPQCGCRDLFIRKDFPQKLGLALVILAGGAFLVLAAWRQTFWIGAAILLGAAVVDALLYAVVGKVTVCYRCRSEFTGPLNPAHEGFELSTAEKYRA
jgi:hypothetical protein